MAELGINIQQGTDLNQACDKRTEMEAKIVNIINQLSVQPGHFTHEKCEDVFCQICDYIEKYDRILYATISNKIFAYQKTNTDDNRLGDIITNLDILVQYCYDHSNESDSKITLKVVLKICDHVNLAQQQYQELHISDKEYQEKFERQMRLEKEKLYHDINSHMVTMIGIFTALSFVIFGGINSIETAFVGMEDVPLSKLIAIGCVWGFGLLNLVYIFLYCIAKLNGLNFKNNVKPDANFVQKYQFIVIPNITIIAIMVVSLWGYFVMTNNLLAEVIALAAQNQVCFMVVSIIGFIGMLYAVKCYVTGRLNGEDG